MEGRYSTRSPAVKRLMKEAQELCEPTDQYFAQPLEDNLFEWHFTIRGPVDSDFQAGLYHGRIILPVDYPMKPPSIIWLTPNGRFETNKKICLSISGHHPESWQPSWSIRTALLAIIGFMPTHPGGAIGSLDYKPEERKALAKKSRDWKCPVCGDVSEILLEPSPESNQTSQEAKELASQISFQGEKPKSAENKSSDEATAASPPPSTTPPSTDAASSPAPPACSPASSPLDYPPTPASNTPVSGNMYPPWMWPPVPNFNSAMPPPFMQYPWTCLSMPQGGQQLGSIASQIPRFPYPPSHYTNSRPFYPPGFPLPPGVGMFPCPFPPPATTIEHNVTDHNKYPPVSVNSSSLSPPSGNLGRGSHSQSPDMGSHSQSPDMGSHLQSLDMGSHSQSPDAPRIPNIPPPSPASVVSSQTGNSNPVSPQCSPLRENVLNELLSKVKRVGSDTQTSPVSPQCSPLREHVLNELLSKVKRVGSDIQTSSDAASDTGIGGESPQSLEERKGTVDALINVESDSAVVNETPKLLTACTCKEAAELVSAPHSSDVSPYWKLEDGEQVHNVLSGDNHTTNLEPQTMNLSEISNILKCAFDVPDDMAEENERQDGEALENPQDGVNNTIGDQSPVEDKSQITDTDGSVSVRRKESISESTGREISHSELSVDPGKDGELGNLALEMSAIEQRFNFERHTSNSMPDLEKKFKPGSTKGLRQRQSAYAGVGCDAAAPDEQTVSEPVNASGRQRIEAVAGDSSPRNHQLFRQNAGVAGEVARNQVQEARRAGVGVPEPQPQSCVTCLILLGSFVTIVVILINRLFYLVDFSGIFY